MSEFNFKSQICTSREQSERLLALGLKKETADMALHFSYVDCEGNAYYSAYPIGHQCTAIPAWSLHRLIEMISEEIQTDWNRCVCKIRDSLNGIISTTILWTASNG